jgi:phosphate:Na+ symporter
MFGFLRKMFDAENNKEREKYSEKVAKYEKISDNIEMEIATYLTRILENRDITSLSSRRIRSMFKIIDEIESIADSCYNINRTLSRKADSKSTFSQEQKNNINQMFDLVEQAFAIMHENIELGYRNITLNKANEAEEKINRFRNDLKDEHLKNIEKKKYSYLAGVYYNDIYCEAEKMGDHIINVSESINEILHEPS